MFSEGRATHALHAVLQPRLGDAAIAG